MKKIAALFTAAVFSLTLGIASAEETMPWQEKEATPLLKNKNDKKEENGKKKEKKKLKKQKAKKKKKQE